MSRGAAVHPTLTHEKFRFAEDLQLAWPKAVLPTLLPDPLKDPLKMLLQLRVHPLTADATQHLLPLVHSSIVPALMRLLDRQPEMDASQGSSYDVSDHVHLSSPATLFNKGDTLDSVPATCYSSVKYQSMKSASHGYRIATASA